MNVDEVTKSNLLDLAGIIVIFTRCYLSPHIAMLCIVFLIFFGNVT